MGIVVLAVMYFVFGFLLGVIATTLFYRREVKKYQDTLRRWSYYRDRG